MGTRANIIIKDIEKVFYLYRHNDGYPEGVGVELDEFFKMYFGEYTHADGDDIATKLIKNDDMRIELTSGVHGDIEFVYQFDCDTKTVTVIDWLSEDVVAVVTY